jgi:cell division protein FtsW
VPAGEAAAGEHDAMAERVRGDAAARARPRDGVPSAGVRVGPGQTRTGSGQNRAGPGQAEERGGASVAERTAAARAALTAWLARPLTSFHLVLAVFGLLTAFGLVMVLSASSVQSYTEDGSSYVVFQRQLLYCVVGLALFWVGLRLPLRFVRLVSPFAVLGCLGLLVVVLTPLGSRINGARSWFTLGALGSVQPAELAKLALALWGAHVLVAKQPVLHRWRHLLVPVLPVSLTMFALVMLQPDLGTTLTMAIVLLALLWFAGAPVSLFAVVVAGASAGALGMAAIASYRSDRINAFLNPETADPKGAAYQAHQAAFSLADGGWFGVGIGQGHAKWMYLPNAHNDFIFAIIGEELGLVGCLVVLGLFATLAYVGLRIAARNTDPWHRLVAATLTTLLVGQAAINIGYVVGLLPVTGLPLPLVSSGGTSLAMTMLIFGLLANVARHEPEAVSALHAHGQGRLARWLGLRLPTPYRPPARRPVPARPASGGQPTRPAGVAAAVRGAARAGVEGRSPRGGPPERAGSRSARHHGARQSAGGSPSGTPANQPDLPNTKRSRTW